MFMIEKIITGEFISGMCVCAHTSMHVQRLYCVTATCRLNVKYTLLHIQITKDFKLSHAHTGIPSKYLKFSVSQSQHY